jgi:hypothetical protein
MPGLCEELKKVHYVYLYIDLHKLDFHQRSIINEVG